MFKAIGKLLIVLGFGWAGASNAGLMPPVTVNGQEWLQPVDFVNLSWNDIATACDASTGICTGSLGGNDLTGWMWAGIHEINGLFNVYLGDAGFSPLLHPFVAGNRTQRNSLWAPAFFEDFIPLDCEAGPSGQCRMRGILRNLNGSGLAYSTTIQDGTAETRTDTFSSDQFTGVGTVSPTRGGWFYRDAAEVPTPPIIPLFVLGLAALGFSRQKQKQRLASLAGHSALELPILVYPWYSVNNQ
jgi:hypothetical protein